MQRPTDWSLPKPIWKDQFNGGTDGRLGELDENVAVNRRDIAERIDELTDEVRQAESTVEDSKHES